jgi:hypothetical protein
MPAILGTDHVSDVSVNRHEPKGPTVCHQRLASAAVSVALSATLSMHPAAAADKSRISAAVDVFAIAALSDGLKCGNRPCRYLLLPPVNIIAVYSPSDLKCGNYRCAPSRRPKDAEAIGRAYGVLGQLWVANVVTGLKCGNHSCAPNTRPEDAMVVNRLHAVLDTVFAGGKI